MALKASHTRVLWVLGLSLYLATAVTNVGFIAIDDYDSGIAPVVPSQNHNIRTVVQMADFRSPVPSLTLFVIARLGLWCGITDPVHQYRLVLAVVGLVVFAILTFASRRIMIVSDGNGTTSTDLALLLCGFYFLCPLIFTRSLIETLCTPWLVLSAYFACLYKRAHDPFDLTLSIGCLALSSMYRYQAGVCLLTVAYLVLTSRHSKDWLLFFLASGVCLFLTGLPDLLLKGAWHESLFSYIRFNLAHSSNFGVPPFYSFLLLFLGISIPPTFFARYRGLSWKQHYGGLVPVLGYFICFVGAHTFVPHKEERFMIPMIPFFLMLLIPLASNLLEQKKWARVTYFVIVNAALLIPTSFSVPQYNIVGLARFLHHHPGIHKIVGLEDSLVVFPKAFVLHPLEEGRISTVELPNLNIHDCHTVVAARPEHANRTPMLHTNFTRVAEFKPGFIEALLVKWNPRQNARRGPIELYALARCPLV